MYLKESLSCLSHFDDLIFKSSVCVYLFSNALSRDIIPSKWSILICFFIHMNFLNLSELATKSHYSQCFKVLVDSVAFSWVKLDKFFFDSKKVYLCSIFPFCEPMSSLWCPKRRRRSCQKVKFRSLKCIFPKCIQWRSCGCPLFARALKADK